MDKWENIMLERTCNRFMKVVPNLVLFFVCFKARNLSKERVLRKFSNVSRFEMDILNERRRRYKPAP